MNYDLSFPWCPCRLTYHVCHEVFRFSLLTDEERKAKILMSHVSRKHFVCLRLQVPGAHR